MANIQKAHPQNVQGPLFVDTTCIDCATCFHLAPEIFQELDGKSVVKGQPHGPKEWLLAKRAILSCPTSSIGVSVAPQEFNNLGSGLPFEISEGVFYCGYTSPHSFGASSYLIVRSSGNVLVDSPRFNSQLAQKIEALGGIRYMFLTHQDDVADHKKFHSFFNCKRIIHSDEVNSDTQDCEIQLIGSETVHFASDLKIIMTPGHTKGHMNLIYRGKFLFTGDHLFVDPDLGQLRASKSYCWYSWVEQVKSLEKLAQEKFEWILPGHGGWGYFGVEDSHYKINELVTGLKGQQ